MATSPASVTTPTPPSRRSVPRGRATPAAPDQPRRRPRPGHVGSVGVVQAVAWLVCAGGAAVVAHALVARGGLSAAGVAVAVAVVLVGAAQGVRVRGRRVATWLLVVAVWGVRRLRPDGGRRQAAPEPGAAGPGAAAAARGAGGAEAVARRLVPDLRMTTAGPATARAAVLGDGQAWAVAVAAEPLTASGLPTGALTELFDREGVRLAALQVLVAVGRRPRGMLGGAWVVLRLDPADRHPGLTAPGPAAAHRALRRRARQAAEVLTAEGLRARVLDEAGAVRMLAATVPLPVLSGAGSAGDAAHAVDAGDAGDTGSDQPPPDDRLRESFRGVRQGGVVHRLYSPSAWPVAGLAALGDALARLQAVDAVLSVTITPGPDGSCVAVPLVRLRATAPDVLPAAAARVSAATGCTLRALDGEHGPALRATLPLARPAAVLPGRAEAFTVRPGASSAVDRLRLHLPATAPAAG